MNKIEFQEKINKNAVELNIKLDEQQIEQLYNYMLILLEWNEKMNLTAITEPDEIIIKHFIDSLTINKYIGEGKRILDIGTGAGFPGLPEKILRPDVKMVLADSLNKRISFLNEVIFQLKLEKIDAIHGRAEDLGHDKIYREKFDVIISRAVASLEVLLEYMLPFAKINGICICMKGSNIEDEIKNCEKALKELGGEIINIDKFMLPNSDILRNIIIIKKVKITPARYPRKAGTPAKDPIK